MDEKLLKTTWKQRMVSIVVAIIMLGTSMAAYIMIIMTRGETPKPKVNNEQIAKLEKEIKAESEKLSDRANELSKQHFARFFKYRPEVKGYNAAAANAGGVVKRDLEVGTGEALTEKSTDYLAYYIGFCHDETIFDTSFNDKNNPSTLGLPIAGGNLIEGWNKGIAGMKIGGIREITMPGELAYGETREICGMKNAPLKFIILTFRDKEFSDLQKKLYALRMEILNLERK